MNEGRKKSPDGGRAVASGRPAWRVRLHDWETDRRVRIERVLEDLGAALNEGGTAAPPHVALVALSADGPGVEEQLLLIRRHREAGAHVLAYAAGVEGWVMAKKCRPLIAGAAQLLDAAAGSLENGLRKALGQVFATLAARSEEDARLIARMRALGIEGAGGRMMEIYRQLLRYAVLSDLPVLITGETGTGKERITRALHQCDPKRAAGPFVAVNCGALVSTLAESELFGHRRGAFTGAEHARSGLVRAADRGVLFLDEIGELDPALQTKLLRVLQEGTVLGVGEEREVPVDVRIVAATHRDLPALVAAGRFRADLLHRLCALPLHLPPLRERREDIPALVRHILARQVPPGRRDRPPAPNRDFLEALAGLRLPGNVRQLENLLRQALVNRKDDGELQLADLPAEALDELATQGVASVASRAAPPAHAGAVADWRTALLDMAEAQDWKLARCLDLCESEVVAAALKRMQGNQSRAASLLGVTARCVYNKIRKFGLSTR